MFSFPFEERLRAILSLTSDVTIANVSSSPPPLSLGLAQCMYNILSHIHSSYPTLSIIPTGMTLLLILEILKQMQKCL